MRPSFYNGFHSVFPNSRAKLHYCRWHIGKTWERSANKYVELRVRTRVKKMLKDLLVIRELSSFQQHFAELLAYLRTEGRTLTWGSFFNPDAIMDTTMISERWHLRLKSEFFHRNANNRADCLAYRRSANSSYRSQQSAICHRIALKKFRSHSDRIKQLEPEKWEVYSKRLTEVFKVQRIRDCECSLSLVRDMPLCLVLFLQGQPCRNKLRG
ncbi:hypothetical protein OSTOST_02033 [Ostertagia ostertagi]